MSDARQAAAAQPGSELSMLKQAFLAVERLQTRVRELEQQRHEPIAVIGIGCRFPGGASSPERFAALLRDGVDATTPAPPVARPGWSDIVGSGLLPPAGYLSEDPAEFDPLFFGIAPREAANIDPQQRLVLECAWEALEHAGLNPRGLEGSATGVFLGVASTDWLQLQLRGRPTREVLQSHFAAGVAHSMASGRLSYVLGLQGPSVSMDTACSSSLVALHTACRALRAGDCDLALAGGVNLILAPDFTLAFQEMQMLSADGRCRAFDAAASGFARGEGCGIVVLRRLRDALAAGDRILAVVRGSAVNQDGPSSGLTAPNGPAQVALIRMAQAAAGVAPADVGYVETHGTGTILGDPIEAQALGEAYGRRRAPDRPLLIGSVKTNIGHLEAAAGMAGFIKAVLALESCTILPQLHFRTPNPHIPWSRLPLAVATTAQPFPEQNGTRLAAVSSFGFSGTNVHVILEQAPVPQRSDATAPARRVQVLPLSATTPATLRASARGVMDVLAAAEHALDDVAHTAAVGRAPLPERLVVVAEDVREAEQSLERWLAGEAASVRVGRAAPEPPLVAFLYTGQGSQRPGMGRALYHAEPVFREALDRAADILSDELQQPFLRLLFGEDAGLLRRTDVAQPALLALELALTELWRSWGVHPARVMGHSAGEYAAAITAGIMSFEDGLRLIAARGRLMQALPAGGAMVAVFTGERTLWSRLEQFNGAVSIAGLNAADLTVLSGDEAAVLALAAELEREGVPGRRLAVSHAFHSRRMEPMLDAFRETAAGIRFAPPRIPLISNITGREIAAHDAVDPSYWCRQIRLPVQFAAGIETLRHAQTGVLLECGPDGTLTAMAMRTLGNDDVRCIASLAGARDEERALAEAVAGLYTAGVMIEWEARDRNRPTRRVTLPATPFARSRYWFAAPTRSAAALQQPIAEPAQRRHAHPLLGSGLMLGDGGWVFSRPLEADSAAYIADHRVRGQVIVPATVHVELLLAAASAGPGLADVALEDLTIREALVLEAGRARSVQVRLGEAADGRYRASVHSLGEGEAAFRLHVEATLASAAPPALPALDLPTLAARLPRRNDHETFYRNLARRGLDFGPALRHVHETHAGAGEALGMVQPQIALESDGYCVHPALLDASIQVLAAALDDAAGELYLPVGIRRLQLHAGSGAPCYSHVLVQGQMKPGSARPLTADIVVYDAQGAPAVSLAGIELVPLRSRDAHDGWVHRVVWERAPALQDAGEAEPQALVRSAEAALRELGAVHGAEAYGHLHEELEALAVAYISRALRRLGWQPTPGETITALGLRQQCGIIERHARLSERMLRLLAQAGVLRAADEGCWRVVQPLPDVDAEQRAAAAAARFSPHDAELTLLARCGARLASVLRGETDPLELLFPGGDTSTLSRIYRDTPVAHTLNCGIREAVRGLVASCGSERGLRVLEIGAGTGGTTAHVLEVLPANTSYTFTDIGRSFINRAREAFAHRPGVHFATLDIGQDPLAQGFAPQSFDLVLASNVLHATPDLECTLAHVHSLLAPGGLLCVLEVTRPRAWVDLTVGLTEGWWLFQDVALRGEDPVLGRDAWRALLERTGYEAAAATSELPEASGLAGNAILLARRPAELHERRWLVVSFGSGAGAAFARQLSARGAAPYVVEAGAQLEIGERGAIVPPGDATAFRSLLEQSAAAAAATDVVVFAPAQQAAADEATQLEQLLGGTLHLVQALVNRPGPAPRLQLVTRGGQATSDDESVDPVQAALWGMARSIEQEHPELRCRCVDLDPDSEWNEAAQQELLADDVAETETALRASERRVPRIVPVKLSARPAAGMSRRLEYGRRGLLEDLTFSMVPRREPDAHEIEIEVIAAGLNFRDVVHALGVRADVPVLGTECVGRVVARGSEVSELAVGDLVMAAGGAFGDHVTLAAGLAVRVPGTLSAVQAATIPIAFLTAERALAVAGVHAGQRVLIHAAAGGVGMAAVQLAVAAGLEVYGTASTPEKRRAVKQLGARAVFDSRSTAFLDEVRAVTGGAGADVVINSLAGEAIAASLRALAPGGVLVELGKTGEWDQARAQQLEGVQPDVRYVRVDLTEDLQRRPELIQASLRALAERLARGELRPLPTRTFPLSRAEDAFRLMAAGRHTGKLVLLRDGILPVRRDGAYLVTGGLAGLGLRVAERLAELGAGALLLAGRSAPSPDATARIEALRAHGTSVHVLQVDVAAAGALAAAIAELPELPPLRGVVHAAGTLRDGVLVQQTWAQFAEVLAAKAGGVRQIEAITRDAPLDFLLLFSSAAGMLGSPGQANHAAANAFLDAVAAARIARGLPAAALAWGAWGEIGAAVRHGANTRAARRGMGTIDPERGIALMEQLAQAGYGSVLVTPVRWAEFVAGKARPARLQRVLPAAAHTVAEGAAHATGVDGAHADAAGVAASPVEQSAAAVTPATGNAASDARATLQQCTLTDELAVTPPARRRALLRERIGQAAVRVLGLPAGYEIDDRQPLNDLGLDSLMAVELRNALGALIGRSLPATLLFDQPTLAALTAYLGRQLIPAEAAISTAPSGVSSTALHSAPFAAPLRGAESSELASARSAGAGDLAALLGQIEELSAAEVAQRLERDPEAHQRD